jgi:hypothetical protein
MSESRMEGKIDAIKQDVHEIKVILAVNTASLETHIKRTALLEQKVESFWSKALVMVSLISGLTLLGRLLLGL